MRGIWLETIRYSQSGSSVSGSHALRERGMGTTAWDWDALWETKQGKTYSRKVKERILWFVIGSPSASPDGNKCSDSMTAHQRRIAVSYFVGIIFFYFVWHFYFRHSNCQDTLYITLPAITPKIYKCTYDDDESRRRNAIRRMTAFSCACICRLRH